MRVLQDAGSCIELFATPGPRLAGELACKAVDKGCDLILAAGGDGTINEAVNGIAGSSVQFGILPAGTANVLANEIGFSNRPDHAARQLLHTVPVRIALGLLEKSDKSRHYFVLMAGLGLDARIVYELDNDLKNMLGKLAYWHGGLRQLGRPVPRFHLSVGGAEYCASFALVTRVRNYGGDFEIAQQVRLTDNDFEVVIFQNNQWQDYVRFFGAVLTKRLYNTEGVTIVRATHVEADSAQKERIYVQVDGESQGTLPASMSVVPDALTLMMPKRYANA